MSMEKNRKLFTRLLPLVIILTATIGAGIADVAFTDIVPNRPYTAVFRFAPIETIGRSTGLGLGDILMVSMVVILIASLLAAVANRTTGIVIAHSGFTPNPNVTGTPGVASVIQLYPLFFAFLGIGIIAFRYLKREEAGV